MKNKYLKVLLLGSLLTTVLYGCESDKDKDKEKVDKELVEEVVKVDYEVNEQGVEVFDMEFAKSDKLLLNPKIDIDKLEEEYIVFTYSDMCSDCTEVTKFINDYVKKEGSLPVYALDFTKSENSEVLDYLINKGYVYTNTPTYAYVYKDEIYKTSIADFKLEDLPVKGSFSSLKPIEFTPIVDSHNHLQDDGHDHSEDDGHDHSEDNSNADDKK